MDRWVSWSRSWGNGRSETEASSISRLPPTTILLQSLLSTAHPIQHASTSPMSPSTLCSARPDEGCAPGPSTSPLAPPFAGEPVVFPAPAPASLAQAYTRFLIHNAPAVASVESTVRSATYLLPGRFEGAEIASEGGQSRASGSCESSAARPDKAFMGCRPWRQDVLAARTLVDMDVDIECD